MIKVSEIIRKTLADTSLQDSLDRYQTVDDSSSVMWLEKAPAGKVTVDDIREALDEYINLFKAGLASKAEILTLSRAFPSSSEYSSALGGMADDPIVIGGPASVELVDREGHLITTNALANAFKKFMDNTRTRNVMVLHSDVQVGWALPAYISQGGQIFKSGVDDKGLFFICELRDDTAISKKVAEQIHSGQLKSYSIAGSATKTQNINKGATPYLQVDDMELAEVTVCEKGVNQGASFELLKAEMPQTGKVDKDQCGYRDATPPETALGINCGHCKYFNSEDRTCDVVVGDIMPGDYCKLFEPCEEVQSHTKKVIIMNSDNTKMGFLNTFNYWMSKKEAQDPLKSKESFATLNNEEGRQTEHKQFLVEYGFPLEMDAEEGRYIPVVEVETDDDGTPIHNLPPWVVNEAGEALGNRLDVTDAKAKVKNGVQVSGEKAKKTTTQKMALDTISKAFDVEKRRPKKPFGRPQGSENLAHTASKRATPIGDPTQIQQPEPDSEGWIGGEGNKANPSSLTEELNRRRGVESSVEKGKLGEAWRSVKDAFKGGNQQQPNVFHYNPAQPDERKHSFPAIDSTSISDAEQGISQGKRTQRIPLFNQNTKKNVNKANGEEDSSDNSFNTGSSSQSPDEHFEDIGPRLTRKRPNIAAQHAAAQAKRKQALADQAERERYMRRQNPNPPSVEQSVLKSFSRMWGSK